MPPITFEACGVSISFSCIDSAALGLLHTLYADFPPAGTAPQLHYSISRESTSYNYRFSSQSGEECIASGLGELSALIDADVCVAVQLLRPKLYFIHSAVLRVHGRTCMIVGASGAGKSTLTLALVKSGCAFMSDELAPIELPALTVLPFPRALTLKSEPPFPASLDRFLQTERGFHANRQRLGYTAIDSTPMPLDSIFFISTNDQLQTEVGHDWRLMTPGESAALLYANTLNQLAHPDVGLAAACRISKAARCYVLPRAHPFELRDSILRISRDFSPTA